MSLKEDVRLFIKENGPVQAGDILEHFDAICECCGQRTDRASEVQYQWIQLLDEGRIITDAKWNYRTRPVGGGD